MPIKKMFFEPSPKVPSSMDKLSAAKDGAKDLFREGLKWFAGSSI
jgi:hypothetical protein